MARKSSTPLAQLKKTELLALARKHRIRGRSKMRKAALLAALQEILEPAAEVASPAPAATTAEATPADEPDADGIVPGPEIGADVDGVEAGAAAADTDPEPPPPHPEPLPRGRPDLRFAEARLPERLTELPFSYAEDRLVLLVRDPHSLFCYWDFAPATYLKIDERQQPLVLRLHDLSGRSGTMSVTVPRPGENKYYLHLARAGTRYLADLVLVDEAGEVDVLFRSSPVATPPDTPAELVASRRATFRLRPPPADAAPTRLETRFGWAYAASGGAAPPRARPDSGSPATDSDSPAAGPASAPVPGEAPPYGARPATSDGAMAEDTRRWDPARRAPAPSGRKP